MTKVYPPNNKFDWLYTRWGGLFAVQVIYFWAKIHRKTNFVIELEKPFDPQEVTVIASNHQTLLDPPAIFCALPLKHRILSAPTKFMTWHKYYNSIYRLPLYTTGCFPSHGNKNAGVEGAVYYATHGYRSFIFPEGRRTKPNERGKVYDGVSKIIEQLPGCRVILVHIDWEERSNFFSRPALRIKFFDAPKGLDTSSPQKIMDAIYEDNR